jgi:SAM-dependent methyltransferase
VSGDDPRAAWHAGAGAEVEFWEWYLRTGGGEWPEEFAHRTDPQAPLDDDLVLEALDEIAADEVDILDVGSGPLTTLGKVHPHKVLRITAVDPLAEEYAALLDELGIEAPVPTQRCAGEELVDRFGRERFDIAYARNSLDHSLDPVVVIGNMLDVVRPGGRVLLRHFEDEAENAAYEGLHQWNLQERDGRLLVWRPGQPPTDVGATRCRRADGWITAVLERR